MLQIFSLLTQTFRKRILILGMLSLSILSSLFVFIQQPSLAAPVSTEGKKLLQMEQMEQKSQAANKAGSSREQAYEEQVKAAEDPDKVYEENLKEYKQSNPGENPVQKAVEGAKNLVDQATGNE